MKIKKIILLSIFALSTTFLAAQDFYFTLNYSPGLPLGETSDYIGKTSWRGIGLEGQWMMNDNVSVGYYFAWNVFKEKVSGSFVDGNRTLTGTQVRYLNTLPIMLEGRYHFGDGLDSSIRPYIGAGVGTIRTLQRTNVGVFSIQDNKWQFGLAPVVGLLIPLDFSTSLNISAKYNYALKAGDVPDRSYLSINLGISWAN